MQHTDTLVKVGLIKVFLLKLKSQIQVLTFILPLSISISSKPIFFPAKSKEMCSIQTVLCKNPLNPHLFRALLLLSHHFRVQTAQLSPLPALYCSYTVRTGESRRVHLFKNGFLQVLSLVMLILSHHRERTTGLPQVQVFSS